jgi:hypothetical protein
MVNRVIITGTPITVTVTAAVTIGPRRRTIAIT